MNVKGDRIDFLYKNIKHAFYQVWIFIYIFNWKRYKFFLNFLEVWKASDFSLKEVLMWPRVRIKSQNDLFEQEQRYERTKLAIII